MNIAELLKELAQQGVRLSADGDHLNIRAPKGVLTSQLQTSLSQHKAEILTLLRKPAAEPRDSFPQIVPAPRDRQQPFPLTDIQQAYWIGRQDMELGNVGCHFYLEFESSGLDLPRLNLAWQRLIERHDMLRAIALPEGQQRILAQAPRYQIEILDLREREQQFVASRLKAIRQELSNQVFTPGKWPLFDLRATIIENLRLIIHISLDLLIADAASIFLLFQEWSQLYQKPDAPLPPLELSFRDYVLAERAFRGSDKYERSKAYWFDRLPALPPPPEIPLVVSPALIRQPHFVRRAGTLEPDAWKRLKTRASRSGLTPSGTVCAAYSAVLGTWSRNSRFTLNLTLFNRLPFHPQVKDIIGDFTSTVLLEVDTNQESFEVCAQRIQKQLSADMNYIHVSGIEVIREHIRTRGGAEGTPMPVVLTSLLGHGRSQGEEPFPTAWLGESIYGISQTPQVWIDHQVLEKNGSLLFNWDAVEDLFPDRLLDDMFDAYCRLIRRLADDEQVWQETPLKLAPSEQIEQRTTINATDAPVPDVLLHTMFAEQAVSMPGHTAVVSSKKSLTYGELHLRTKQLGRKLREHGARPNSLVAVVMEKGWEQVVAVLAILHSGAAYLPVDAGLPKERIWYLLEQGEVKLVLTQSWLDDSLAWPEGIQRLSVDAVDFANGDTSPLEPVASQEDLAYVIFTSGSTGLPKGVMIDHRGAVNTITDINKRFGLGPEDRVLALSSLSFDLSVYDIFGTLAAGGTIVVPDSGATRDPAHWAELMSRERVTVWNSVPALMKMLVEYCAGQPEVFPPSLRLALLSGDWIPVSLPDEIKSLTNEIQVVSLGGATEASIWSILYPIAELDSACASIPYGRPMTNQRFHVLNESLETCPVWVPGQLYIGGIGLARGYWHDEDKTRSSFFLHPRTQERLYKTGDLGRYLPDGNIEFLGREDFQVKIQGHRIDLGEIEVALSQHPLVRATVVTALGELKGDKRLVAYVVPDQEKSKSQQPNGSKENYLEAFGSHLDGMILDPIERLEFTLSQPGLRLGGSNGDSVQLEVPKLDQEKYTKRRSHRGFLHEPISFKQFSEFLTALLPIPLDGSVLPKYLYPSAGSLYPVQTYLYVKPNGVQGLSAGTYYYHPKEHRLVPLSAGAHIDESVHAPHNQTMFAESAFSVFLVAQMRAIAPMYGDLARDFCMLEAGYMSQILMDMAPASEIGLCAIGGLDFERVRKLFVLEDSHLLLHSLIGGRVDTNQSRTLSTGSYAGRSASPRPLAVELRSFLNEKLPAYMVPAVFVPLDSLPLTFNGKVDRKALPAPEDLRPQAETSYVAPATELEIDLAGIVKEILNVDKVGIHDNFFELGANSVQIVQVHSKLREVLKRDLAVVEMFKHPTISLLEEYLSQEGAKPPSFEQIQEQAHKQRQAANRKKHMMEKRRKWTGQAPTSL